MKDHTEEKPEPVPDMVHSGRHSSCKKKSGKSNVPSINTDYFKGIMFQIGKDGPNCMRRQ